MVRKASQKETAAQDWKNRMRQAKSNLPEMVGQQMVIEKVIELDPDLDSLANSTRWRNAWFLKVSDPHITQLVEDAVKHFQTARRKTVSRLKRQKLAKHRQ